jgi:hypothetical protein
MDININFTNLWTYNIKIPPNIRNLHEKKAEITLLNDDEYTHIHGDLTIKVKDKFLPKMGFSSDDVCFNYWVEEFAKLFKNFDLGLSSYKIEGMDQGMPAYLFEKKGQIIYLSVVSSLNGGKADPLWQKVMFDYKDFKDQYNNFKNELLTNIEIHAPSMLYKWSTKFR